MNKRFIHDIIVATLKATGFPNGYFELEELDSSNYKDSKVAKVAFLNKLVQLVNVGNGAALQVSSSKIVAGLEPLNTNILLATFGRLALDDNMDRNSLVQHCLSGKGVEEFRSTNIASLANATDAKAEGASPNVPEENGAITQHDTIMKQIESCNEDISQTRDMISKIVAKPKCSDKLLSKPPFRFIHDLIVAIGNATEFDLCQIFR